MISASRRRAWGLGARPRSSLSGPPRAARDRVDVRTQGHSTPLILAEQPSLCSALVELRCRRPLRRRRRSWPRWRMRVGAVSGQESIKMPRAELSPRCAETSARTSAPCGRASSRRTHRASGGATGRNSARLGLPRRNTQASTPCQSRHVLAQHASRAGAQGVQHASRSASALSSCGRGLSVCDCARRRKAGVYVRAEPYGDTEKCSPPRAPFAPRSLVRW